MKKIFLLIILFIALHAHAHALDITLAWDANTEEDLAGYKLYFTGEIEGYTSPIDIPVSEAPQVRLDIASNPYCFKATAVNTVGLESDFSNEVCVAPPATPRIYIVLE